MSDVDLLHRAAEHIRDTVARLPEGHRTRWLAQTLEPNEVFDDTEWWVKTDITVPTPDGRRTDTTLANVVYSRADADHMALWHPVVAQAVAEWLDACADTWPTQPVITTTAERSRERRAALATARALLGEA